MTHSKMCNVGSVVTATAMVSALAFSLIANPLASAAVLFEYDSGAGAPLSPTTQGWTASEIIEEDLPGVVLATAIEADPANTDGLANAGPGSTGWIIRDFLDGGPGNEDRPEYNVALTTGDFNTMQSNGWSFTTRFMMDAAGDTTQEMRILSMDQGGGNGLPFDIKVNGTYVGDVLSGNLGLSILGGGGEVDTGVAAEQFNTVIFADVDGDGSFTIDVNGNLLNGGATFDSNPSAGDVPGDDVLVFGANSTGGDGGGVEYDFLRLEVGDGSFITGLTIDRGNGNITLSNDTAAAKPIVGYKILSTGGALNPGDWLSISDNYDFSGNGTVDANDEWVELTATDSRNDLSEFEPDGDGGSFGVGQSINFGNAWIRNPSEEGLSAELLLIDGTVELVSINFTGGPNNAAYDFGDIDFDGDFDVADFTGTFVPGFGADTSNKSEAEQYQAGDFNNDNVVDEIDFLILNEAYLAANPLAAPLSFSLVPEPTSAILLLCGSLALFTRKRELTRKSRNWQLRSSTLALLATCALIGLQSRDAQAQPNIMAHWSFDETSGTNLVDSTGGNNGTAQGVLTGSANTGQIGNAWSFGGGFLEVANNNEFTSLTADYSFSMWINTTSNGPSVMWSVSDSTNGSEEVAMRINDFSPEGTVGGVHYMGRPNVSQAVSTSPVNDAQWHHVVATQAPTGWALYVDGVLEKSGPQVHSPALIGADTARIGVNTDDGSVANGQWAYNGLLDDLSIWDGPLSAEEVGNLYLKGLVGIAAPDPFDSVLTLEVNRSTGEAMVKNEAGIPFEIDLYRVISPGDSLNPNGWNSLDDQNFDSSAWTQLGNVRDKVSEGAFGDSTVFANGSEDSLSLVYDRGVDAQDLVFEYHLVGTPATLLVEGNVEYFEEPADANGDGVTDINDLNDPTTGLLANYGNGVNGLQILNWQVQAGSGGGLAASQAVPEPASLSLLALSALGLLSVRRRQCKATSGICALAIVSMLASVSTAAITNDRDYQLGDDGAEGAIAGNTVGSAVGNVTFDSAGTVGTGNLQDLTVSGDPTYVDVSNRPGASGGDLGADFDGSGDYLITGTSMNDPSDMWDNETFFPPGQEFPQNYETITSHGIQLWAKPDVSAFGQSNRQGLVFDTFEHGILITANDTWGLWYDPDDGGLGLNPEVDSGVTVSSTLDSNGWAHVMQIVGTEEPIEGGSDDDAVLLVNGVAVAAKAGAYDDDASELVVGASLDPDNIGQIKDEYDGVLDDVRLFLWGDNSEQDSGDGRLGQDYGTFNLATDNEWIASQLQTLGVTDAADVNLEGSVSGDGSGPAATDDVTMFVDNWLSTRTVNGVQVGDWVSRQNGDLNFDGIVDIDDAFALRTGLIASGLGTLDFDLLVANVPEPTTGVMTLLGVVLAMGRRRW
ncbi:MAG: LamG domain-containing protein [Bythopirellula sp.]